jgi:hypothetical protein
MSDFHRQSEFEIIVNGLYFTMEHFPLCQIMILRTFNEKKKKHPHKINVNEMVAVFKLISK